MIKKILFIIISTCIINLTVSSNVYGEELVFGDTNSDNDINAIDALNILKYSAKIITVIDDKVMITADVNGDKTINSNDALLILKYASRMIDSFPCEKNIVITETPATETPEPTEKPTANPDDVFDVSVKSLNDVAVFEGNEIAFLSRQRHEDGVEMNNPFASYIITDGVTVSFWYTPPENITDKYGNTALLTFVHEEKAQIIKFDMEGSYQYADGESFINYWDPNFEFVKDTSYFMTCVISSQGLKYYVNGAPVPIFQRSLISTSQAIANLLPLIMDSDTKLYVGGTDNIWWNEMASLAAHDLPIDTKIRELKAYMKPMTTQEVMSLYNSQID